MRRRDFIRGIAGSAAVWPLAARAQRPERVRRIGVLMRFAKDNPESKLYLAAFRLGLAKRGWSEGRNVQIDYRFAAVSARLIQAFAKELVALQPDAILAHTPPVAAALQRESGTIPIVFVNVSDPIGSGLVASLARPGGNLTGVLHYEASLLGKVLAMLKEIAPYLARVAFVANPKSGSYDYFLRAAEAVAPSLAVNVVPTPIENAAGIERSIESFARGAPDGGLVLPPDAMTLAHRNLIVALAARHRLPAVYPFNYFVEAGNLMSYGTDQDAMYRLAASYVDRILRGDKPADLPVQAPTRYQMAVNLKTAKALGLTVPSALLVAADEVIE
jgi:ABC-type uncharacterized transport system substrate-binding protein